MKKNIIFQTFITLAVVYCLFQLAFLRVNLATNNTVQNRHDNNILTQGVVLEGFVYMLTNEQRVSLEKYATARLQEIASSTKK